MLDFKCENFVTDIMSAVYSDRFLFRLLTTRKATSKLLALRSLSRSYDLRSGQRSFAANTGCFKIFLYVKSVWIFLSGKPISKL
jgi:hypothetical protein